jgi:hypothetical protein
LNKYPDIRISIISLAFAAWKNKKYLL